MQKNKIDVVKAVCNNAARKLTVLSLAVAVSGGAVANANPPKGRIVVLPSTTQGKGNLRVRLFRLEIDRENKIKQEGDIKRQIIETERRKKNIQYLLAPYYPEDVVGGDRAWWGKYRDALESLENELLSLNEALEKQILTIASLDVQIEALRAQIAREQQEAPVEEIIEVVPEDEEQESSDEIVEVVSEDEEREEPQHENQSEGTTNTTALQGLMPNVMNLPEQTIPQQQNQPVRYFGGILNPFNWGFFGGGKK